MQHAPLSFHACLTARYSLYFPDNFSEPGPMIADGPLLEAARSVVWSLQLMLDRDPDLEFVF